MKQPLVDYYAILQVHHDAEREVIDAAYRCLSRMYHPDVNRAPAAAERMKEINAAYAAVGDEITRAVYHRRWMASYALKTLAERENGFGWHDTENREVYHAYTVLDAFFRETMNEKWQEAYERLTASDRANVSFAEFLAWKQAVHQVYRLGNYNITFFRRYHHCEYAGKIYPKIFHFIVPVTELELVGGQIARSSSHKYVALEDGRFSVCLGSTDLKPSTEKFRKIARVLPQNDQEGVLIRAASRYDAATGLLNREGWLEEAEREMARSRRYGNPLCFGVLGFHPGPTEDGLPDEDSLERNMACVAGFLAERVRKSDIVGRCSDLTLAFLFTETRARDGKKALRKLTVILQQDPHLRKYFPCHISAMIRRLPTEEIGQSLQELIGNVSRPEDGFGITGWPGPLPNDVSQAAD